jgi:hypothetical protein
MTNTTTCPSCRRQLRIPETLAGQPIKCPACSHNFAPVPDADERPAREPPPASPPVEDSADRRERRHRDDDERPVRAKRYDDDDDDRVVRRRRSEDVDDYDDRPRKRRPPAEYEPHRGTLILILGICSWAVCGLCGPVAWFLGNQDMQEIRAGRMDPEGESMTQVGRYLGMAITLLTVFSMLIGCVIFAIVVAVNAK